MYEGIKVREICEEDVALSLNVFLFAEDGCLYGFACRVLGNV